MWKKLLIRLTVGALLASLIPMSAGQVGVAQEREPGKTQTERVTGTQAGVSRETSRVVKEIRHELLTLPYYGVFDWLEGEVRPDGTVVLRGHVVRPTTKSDAEARVRDIEAIEKVINEITVLPVSPNDERLRIALYRAIFADNSPLFRYALGANPAIHIIVENGRATLKGVVSSEADKQLAYTKARSVAGLFEVRNDLVIEKSDRG
jgi:osmotically-inducible protein OsmY